jgi:hypothetical protein
MEVLIELTTCRACGSLYYRPAAQAGWYCRSCVALFSNFPTVESRKRRGRPKVLKAVYASADESGGKNEP